MARRDIPRRPDGGRSDPQPPKGSKLGRWLRRTMVWGAGFALLGIITLVVAVAVTMRSLPGYQELKSTQTGQMIVVRAADGTELVTLGPSYGRWVPYERIPQPMRDAMVSVEDRRYRSHWGVDPIGIVRSLMVRVESGSWKQGGSTITQQLARNIFLNNTKTFGRKAREWILALALEQKFSKDQILELYLNKVYFGGGAYGIDSAARKFFGHSGEEITLPEAAIIAGLVKAPSRYSPTADAKAAVGRAGVVLQTMESNGYLTAQEAQAVDLKKVKMVEDHAGQNSARYFTDWALPQLDIILPENDQPIEVWTTLDPVMQKAATSAIAGFAPKGAQGALVSLDRDGAVLAMVGGTDYVSSNYNRAVNAVRQPGSAWKLFVYLTALEAGYTPDDRVVDEPVTIEGWTPRNDGGRYAGEIDLRTAFAYSKNTVAAQLGPAVWHYHADQHAAFDGSGIVRGARDRHGARFCFGAGQRHVGHALWHPKGDDDRGRAALPVSPRIGAATGSALCCRRHDRSDADCRQHRNGPRRADRTAGGGEDRDDLVQQGRLVPGLFQRDHHGRVDGARRCQGRSRLAGRRGSGAGLCGLYEGCHGQASGGKVRYGTEIAAVAA
jgi:penicillin-binding protein 1A